MAVCMCVCIHVDIFKCTCVRHVLGITTSKPGTLSCMVVGPMDSCCLSYTLILCSGPGGCT